MFYIYHMKKNELIKARPAIQITGSPSTLQRKAWNVMLAHAYDNLHKQEIHQIEVIKIADALGFDSNNHEHLKDALRALQACSVEWNILNEDGKKEWGVAGFVAESRIIEGVCYYAYSPTMRKYLHNPAIYARLDLQIQNLFTSKYTLAIWELCSDYRKVGSTGWIEIDTFKRLLCANKQSHKDFMVFNRAVLKPAIKELNEKQSDFLVTVEFERFKRRIVKVRLLITEKKMITDESKNEKQSVGNRKKADPACKICGGTGWEFIESNITKYCKCTYA
jgi:plasmid replication initiation protein